MGSNNRLKSDRSANVKKISFTLRANISLAVVALLGLFLAASAPHRVHHLLDNLPPPKTQSGNTRELSLSSAPHRQHSVSQSSEPKTQTAGHDLGTHDHASHSHHHNEKSQRDHHHHDHAHKHSHRSHSHDADLAHAESASEANQTDAEPLHANAPKRDAHHDNSAQTNCIVQAAAQNAHFTPVESAKTAFFGNEFDNRATLRPINFTSFDPSPCSQRAPPRV